MKRILFVCTGNTCRSPMATAILKYKNIYNLEVRSAGIFAHEYDDISKNAEIILKKNNIFFEHRVKRVDRKDIEWADLVLTMSESHRQNLILRYSWMKDKIYRLSDYVDLENVDDIYDPYGGTLEDYEYTFQQLKLLIQSLIKNIT